LSSGEKRQYAISCSDGHDASPVARVHGMVLVAHPAVVADHAVDGHSPALIQLQSEDTDIWKRIAVMLPSVAPLAAPEHRALLEHHVETPGNTPNLHQRCRQGRGRGCVKMGLACDGGLGQVERQVMLRSVEHRCG
jgi:hypothetical protein